MPKEQSTRTKARSSPSAKRHDSDSAYEEAGNTSKPAAPIRGRPRKTTVDIEAVERRRTQLRVAQRAFRKKRDDTIDELRDQVAKLTDTHDKLLSSLRAFAERAARQKLPDDLASDLGKLLSMHSNLQYDGNGGDGKSSKVINDDNYRPTFTTDAVGTQSAVDKELNTRPIYGLGSRRYDSVPQTIALHSMTSERQRQLSPEAVPMENNAKLLISTALTVPSNPPQSLRPTTPMGFDETSFSNRLRRRGIEAGYQLCTNSSLVPRTFERVFRWPLNQGQNESMIIMSLRERLACSPLELLQTAEININWSSIPHPDMPGLEETWFFPADVEAYLAKKGVKIDPGAWFVNAKLKRQALFLEDGLAGPHDFLEPEPLYQAIVQKHCGPMDDVYKRGLTSVTTNTTSTTPGAPTTPKDMSLSYGDFNEITTLYEDVVMDPLLFQLHELDWMSEDWIPTADEFALKVYPTQSTLLPHIENQEEASYSDPSLSAMQAERQTYDLLAEKQSTIFALDSEPSWYMGTSDSSETVSTQNQEKDDSLVDVTLNITQLMSNLLLSVNCLGSTQGYKKADIDRALRASVMLHG